MILLMTHPGDPVGAMIVCRPFAAYCQGFDAALADHPARLCPYPDDSTERRWWLMGHFDASVDEAGAILLPEDTGDWSLAA
ncbi:MAG TPA: Rmf/CrpP family protein [Gemmatimonadales bacterium]|nr:Rmf/CrpP family protein [Gemmatimonadales bacterium]